MSGHAHTNIHAHSRQLPTSAGGCDGRRGQPLHYVPPSSTPSGGAKVCFICLFCVFLDVEEQKCVFISLFCVFLDVHCKWRSKVCFYLSFLYVFGCQLQGSSKSVLLFIFFLSVFLFGCLFCVFLCVYMCLFAVFFLCCLFVYSLLCVIFCGCLVYFCVYFIMYFLVSFFCEYSTVQSRKYIFPKTNHIL